MVADPAPEDRVRLLEQLVVDVVFRELVLVVLELAGERVPRERVLDEQAAEPGEEPPQAHRRRRGGLLGDVLQRERYVGQSRMWVGRSARANSSHGIGLATASTGV